MNNMADKAKSPSLWDTIKTKSTEALAPYQMGEASNKVHQIYTQPQPKQKT